MFSRIEFWFHKRSRVLEIVNLTNGKRWTFNLQKIQHDSRFDYGGHEDPEDTTDTEEYYGASGFTRMRIWEKELKGYNPETMENEDDL